MFRVTLIVLVASGLCAGLSFLFGASFVGGSVFGLISTATLSSVFRDVALVLVILSALCLVIALILKLLVQKKG